jgi:hypothetical protein
MKKIAFILLAVATLAISFNFKMMANPFLGKWQLKSKIVQKLENGKLQEGFEKNYKPNKKIYEFMVEDKLTVIEDDGKTKEKKKYVVEGNLIYIGKEKTEKNQYIFTFNKDNTVTLNQKRIKTKEGITFEDIEILTFEKLQ